MSRVQLSELSAFAAVADSLSFTRAAAHLGCSLPTISQTIKSLEERLDVRLFNRTTRSVALTEAGERLLAEIQPILERVDQAIESINAFRDKPVGTLRLTVSRVFALRGLGPLIRAFLAEYPGINLELAVDDTNSDIVRNRFDAGIRAGHRVERDMKVIRVFEDCSFVAVASPHYLASHPAPIVPDHLRDHNCIRHRAPADDTLQPWIFDNGAQRAEIAVDGSLIVNDFDLALNAALDGVGIAYLVEPMIQAHVAEGRLVRLLPGWEYATGGLFLYHPSRRQPPMPLQVFLDFVKRWRSSGTPDLIPSVNEDDKQALVTAPSHRSALPMESNRS
ncbi:putative transcriptional regulator with periplasmic binding protein domain (LysR family) [Bradyrhizobium sp. ORS 375]|uniref:LysR family transcriptional regulator n=1 Tax=Bradyrhizobium sp. (strain ORS 375) TaxID=566679 RepID=UPI0002408B2A|nr:LysR family transcriptional regulator [Bradyrhizobium sp. ORS 375]CCD92711.1 putative transcriptional regulator with periplasmic binding protein domain (LysR family) [Bradyrhizobium sp. ORS 375]